MSNKTKKVKALTGKLNQKDSIVFWETKSNNIIKINQHKLMLFLGKGGFCKIATKTGIRVVRVVENIVSDAPDHEIIDYVKNHLISEKEQGVLELFSTGISSYINKAKLNLLSTVNIPIDKDSKDASWFYFKNTAVKVTKDRCVLVGYEDLPHKIWESRILNRDFNIPAGTISDFDKFLYNLAGKNDERFSGLKTIIGYLLHRYQNKSSTKAMIFVDENMSFDGRANGGTGKTLITEAIGKMRELVGMDGKNIKTNSGFKNQRIEATTDIIRYDDVQRGFSLENLYSMITSGITVEKKYQDEFYISPENAPKIVISSNYPVKGTGGSSDTRRRCEFEVANHYNENHQPIDDFGKHFFDDWSASDWNDFDQLMMNCAMAYLDKGLIIPEPINLVKNKLVVNTSVDFVNFMEDKIEMDKWIDKRKLLKVFNEDYSSIGDISSHQFTKFLKEFASQKEYEYSDRSSGGKLSFIIKSNKR
jgi:hypothetical protein